MNKILTQCEHGSVALFHLHTGVLTLVCFPWNIEPWKWNTSPVEDKKWTLYGS